MSDLAIERSKMFGLAKAKLKLHENWELWFIDIAHYCSITVCFYGCCCPPRVFRHSFAVFQPLLLPFLPSCFFLSADAASQAAASEAASKRGLAALLLVFTGGGCQCAAVFSTKVPYNVWDNQHLYRSDDVEQPLRRNLTLFSDYQRPYLTFRPKHRRFEAIEDREAVCYIVMLLSVNAQPRAY